MSKEGIGSQLGSLLETEANEVESIGVLLSDSHLVPTERIGSNCTDGRAEQTLAKSLRDLLHAPSSPPPY